jgi:DNA replication protein DnaC
LSQSTVHNQRPSTVLRSTQLAKTDIVILDDLAMTPLTDSARRDLLEVLDDRHGNCPTLATSLLPVDHWRDAIGETTVADAILDRLVHNTHRLTTTVNQCARYEAG